MIQASTTSYDLKMLLPWNGSYDCAHRLTEDDVQMVNDLTQHIERTRSAHYPKIGDRVIHVSKYGDYSGNALIGKIEKGQCSICLNPYIPFVWKTPLGVSCDISGGPFTSAPAGKLQFMGWTDGHFKDWGHCGACANGAVVFKARVALWEYRDPNPIYGEFTTETWRKIYVTKITKPGSDYLYHGDGIAFQDEAEFNQFVADYEGTVFPGHGENQFVVWCYRDVLQNLSQAEWDALDAPASRRRIYNEAQPIKVLKDHTTHERICYYVQPDFKIR